MADGLLTSRRLQNEATGIDLLVPLHQEVRGSMMTGHVEYQIIVITRLVAFKSPRHKPGDVVQLVVSKKYSEMDEFYYRLIARYPKFPLPAMPRKTLFVGESDIRERRVAFDDLMKAIAKHPTLAACSEASAPSIRRPAAQPKKKPSHIDKNENQTKSDDDEEEEQQSEELYLGPLGNTKIEDNFDKLLQVTQKD
ncbi:hypothetical protein CRUP_011095 [Coryphaenoides rupestris]|nr:hypothetical protein CRUP_011095 [Coryphaenoides rupestris]